MFETLGAINEEGQRILSQLFRLTSLRFGEEFSSYCGRGWCRLSCNLQRSVAQSILNRIDGCRSTRVPDVPTVAPSAVAATFDVPDDDVAHDVPVCDVVSDVPVRDVPACDVPACVPVDVSPCVDVVPAHVVMDVSSIGSPSYGLSVVRGLVLTLMSAT